MRAAPACDCLREDHRRLESLLARLKTQLRPEYAPEFAAAFAAIRAFSEWHFRREEEVLFPALRSRYPALLAQLERQHERLRDLEASLSGLLCAVPAEPDCEWLREAGSLALELRDATLHHIVDEDGMLLRVAAACIGSEQQRRLAAKMAAVPVSGPLLSHA